MTDRVDLHDLRFVESISAATIAARVEALAADLRATIAADTAAASVPLFVGVLRGAAVFHADLVRAYGHPAELDYLRARSYVGAASMGEVVIDLPEGLDLRDRHVVLVEDIADSGRTLAVLAKACRARGAARLTTVVLLDKPDARVVDFRPDFIGFVIPPDFVVGYGLDYRGLGRNLRGIYTRAEE